MKQRIVAFLVILALAVAVSGLAQVKAPTLRDKVRKKAFVWQSSLPEWRTLVTFEDLITRSDVIVRGRVVDEKTRLSRNEHMVWTDYTIEVLEVYKAQRPLTVGARLVVTKTGGNLLLEGKPVRIDTPWFSPIPWIAPHVFFIAGSMLTDAQYSFTGNEVGVFRIKKGNIAAHGFGKKNHPIIDEFHKKSEDEFLRLLKEKVAALAESNPSP